MKANDRIGKRCKAKMCQKLRSKAFLRYSVDVCNQISHWWQLEDVGERGEKTTRCETCEVISKSCMRKWRKREERKNKRKSEPKECEDSEFYVSGMCVCKWNEMLIWEWKRGKKGDDRAVEWKTQTEKPKLLCHRRRIKRLAANISHSLHKVQLHCNHPSHQALQILSGPRCIYKGKQFVSRGTMMMNVSG